MEGFVLHKRRFKETSLLVEFLTLENGRVTAIVKGALREKSKLGSVLHHSLRLKLETVGKSNLPILTKAEVIEHYSQLKGIDIFTLLYINELIIKFFAQNDPVINVYFGYVELLQILGTVGDYQSNLRYFELTILETMGVKPELNKTVDTDTPISQRETYFFDPSTGVSKNAIGREGIKLQGQTLNQLNRGAALDGQAAREAKLLTQKLIQHHLEGGELNVRKFFY